jgi:hypothetical protein
MVKTDYKFDGLFKSYDLPKIVVSSELASALSNASIRATHACIRLWYVHMYMICIVCQIAKNKGGSICHRVDLLGFFIRG